MRRTPWVLVAVISAAALLSGCGGVVADAPAAKLGSTTISRSTLDDQLAVLSANKKWMKALESQFDGTKLVVSEGTVSAKFTAAWLTALMNQVMVDHAFERRDLTVTAKNRADAKTAAAALFQAGSSSSFKALPKWFRDDFLRGQGRYEAVRASLPPKVEPTPAQLEDAFSRYKTSFCPAGDVVSHILVATQAEADAIEAQLAQGADFGTLAATKSTDEGSARRGGFLGCTGNPNYDQLPEVFRQGVAQVPLGSVSPPIQTEFGFSVVKVTAWDRASVRRLLETVFKDETAEPIHQLINNALLRAKLWVDPRYGTVTPSPVRVKPPVAPTPKDDPPLTPSTTAPAGATGQ